MIDRLPPSGELWERGVWERGVWERGKVQAFAQDYPANFRRDVKPFAVIGSRHDVIGECIGTEEQFASHGDGIPLQFEQTPA